MLKHALKLAAIGWVNCGYRNAALCEEYGETEYCTPAQCRKVRGHGKKAKKTVRKHMAKHSKNTW